MGCQLRNGIYCTKFSSVQSLYLIGTWTQKLCDTSPVQGPVSTSEQWDITIFIKQKKSHYYNGLGFGINAHLRSHIDADFTMSIVQAHIDNHDYVMDDKVICYFAFPRIGVAVALRPGDFLLFNPNEPHSISSCCNREDDVYIISSYLKMAVVGLNDNSNPIV